MDLFFYREPEELEKAEEAQAPFQEPATVAAPGWGGTEGMVSAGAAPTPMEGYAAVDPTAVPMEYQAPPAQAAATGGGWDAAPAATEEVAVEQPAQEAMPVDAGVAQGGGWDAAPQQAAQAQAPAAPQGGGWGESSGQAGSGTW